MEPSSNPTSNQQDIFDLFYDENNPDSLTITKKPEIIYNYLFKQGTYLWIVDEPSKFTIQCQKIQKQSSVKINFIKIDDIIPQYSNHERKIIIICNKSLVGQVDNILEPMFLKNKIYSLVVYGDYNDDYFAPNLKYQDNFIYVSTLDGAINQINQCKSYWNSVDFINFISLDKQKLDSNILVKTMFAMIKQQTSTQKIMSKFIQLAKLCFPKNSDDQFKQFSNSYIPQKTKTKKVIKLYTGQTFLYSFINRVLRICKDPTCLYIIQPFFKDLCNAIHKIYMLKLKSSRYKNFKCYRGGVISQKEKQMYKKIGLLIQNLGFYSTSKNIEVAKSFAKNAVFTIEVDAAERKLELDYGFAFVQEISQQPLQEQILFNPLNSFKIIDYEEIEGKSFITLKYGELARLSAAEKYELTQQQQNYKFLGEYQIKQSQQSNHMSHVLVQHCFNLQSSQKYTNKYLQLANREKNSLSIGFGHHLRGILAQNKKDYKTMEKQFRQQLKIYQNIPPECNENKDIINKRIVTSLSYIGISLNGLGQYQESLDLFLKCQKIQKQLGGHQKKYSTILNNLGITCIHLGKYQSAIQYLQKYQKKIIQLHGKDHPEITATLNNLGVAYGKVCQYQKAVQYLLRCQKIRKQCLEENHPVYITTLNNLGIALNQLGKPQEALEYFKKCYQIHSQSQQDYTAILYNLSNIFNSLGQYQTALKYLIKCQQTIKQRFQEEHPQYAINLDNLGLNLTNFGLYQKAMEYLQRSQKIKKKKLGKNHPGYAKTLCSLGAVLFNLCRYKEAMDILIQCQNIQSKSLPEDHKHHVQTLHNLQQTFFKLGQQNQFQIVVKYLLRYQYIQTRLAMKHHPEYAKTLNSLGCAYFFLCQYQNAVEYFLKCQNIQKQLLGEDHPDYAKNLYDLARSFDKLRQFQMAISFFKNCQKIQKQILGEDNQQYLQTLNSLGSTFYTYDKCQQAKQCLIKCQQIRSKTLPENHPLYATTLNDLGSVFAKMGQYKKAVEYLLKCQRIQSQSVQDHPQYVFTLVNLGRCFDNIGQIQKSLQYFHRCQKIQRKSPGKDHPNYADTLYDLGRAYYQLDQYNKSLWYLVRCQKMIRQLYGEDHLEYATILNCLGSSFGKLVQYQKALEYFQKCQEIRRRYLKVNHPQYINIIDNLAAMYSFMGQYEQSMYWANKTGNQYFIDRNIQRQKLIIQVQSLNKVQMTQTSNKIYNHVIKFYKKKDYLQFMRQMKENLAIAYRLKTSHRWILIFKLEELESIKLYQVSKQVQIQRQVQVYQQVQVCQQVQGKGRSISNSGQQPKKQRILSQPESQKQQEISIFYYLSTELMP